MNKCAVIITKVIVGNFHRKRFLRMKKNIVFLQKSMSFFFFYNYEYVFQNS